MDNGSASIQMNQIKNPPKIDPKLLPDPPTITINQIINVNLNGRYDPGVNWPSKVVSIAPAIPIIAEPIIKICKCCAKIFLPIALAASSLSLMALNILPHGEFKAS